MTDSEWLEILCCPETHQKLHEASAEVVQEMNTRISAGQVKNRQGEFVRESIGGLLIREDNQLGYPVRDGIPVLLLPEALPL